MKWGKLDTATYIIRLDHGDDIAGTVRRFCADRGIVNAAVWGVGSIENPTLAHYRMDKGKYSEKSFEGIFEVSSLLGNVALQDGEPLPHLHVTISDEEMNAKAGHLVSGGVSATAEIIIRRYDSEYTKSHDDEVGLKLYDLDQE